MEIKNVTKDEAEQIIDTREPWGLFYTEYKGRFVAIDNSIGDAWVEIFNTLSACIRWLTYKGLTKEEAELEEASIDIDSYAKKKGWEEVKSMKAEQGCYHCKDGYYRDILGSPCKYNFCPICGRELDKSTNIPPEEYITRHEALALVNRERNRQDAKWGEQNHPPQYWTGILGEEYGEYCQAVNETVFYNGEEARKKGGYDNMMKELSHVAAVAIGAMEALMRAKAREEAEKHG